MTGFDSRHRRRSRCRRCSRSCAASSRELIALARVDRRLHRGDRVLAASLGAWLPEFGGIPSVPLRRSRSSLILIARAGRRRARCVAAAQRRSARSGLGFVDRFLGAIFGVARGRRRWWSRSCSSRGLPPCREQDWWQNSALAPPFGAARAVAEALAAPGVGRAARFFARRPQSPRAGLGQKGLTLMCGIVGVVAHTPVNQLLYDGLLLLQHRGQDAAGIVTSEGAVVPHVQGTGLRARRVPHAQHARPPRATPASATAAIRPRARAFSELESQPFYVNSPFGITLGAQRQPDQQRGAEARAVPARLPPRQHQFRHRGAAERAGARARARRAASRGSTPNAIFTAVAGVHRRCRGAYAVVAMIAGYGLLAFRDPFGIRPLIIGVNEAMGGTEYVVASRVGGARGRSASTVLRDVAPGEAIFVDHDRAVPRAAVRRQRRRSRPCIFEYVYLARPDSVIDGTSVYESRLNMGEQLAHKIRGMPEARDIDVVIPIPDSSRPVRARSSRTRSASRIAKASSRTATSAARSSCRGRRCARRACARS